MTVQNWREIVELAEHYIAIGQTDIYLSGDNTTDYPWSFTESCETGGSHRIEIATSVWFSGRHPCGLSFRWSFDLEPRTANGKGSYEIDRDGVIRVMARLPIGAQVAFLDYLATAAAAVQRKANEWAALADRQREDAALLRLLSRGARDEREGAP